MQKKTLREVGYSLDRIPYNVFKDLLDSLDINDISSKKQYNHALVGNIETELQVKELLPESFYQYLFELLNFHCRSFNIHLNNEIRFG